MRFLVMGFIILILVFFWIGVLSSNLTLWRFKLVSLFSGLVGDGLSLGFLYGAVPLEVVG